MSSPIMKATSQRKRSLVLHQCTILGWSKQMVRALQDELDGNAFIYKNTRTSNSQRMRTTVHFEYVILLAAHDTARLACVQTTIVVHRAHAAAPC